MVYCRGNSLESRTRYLKYLLFANPTTHLYYTAKGVYILI
ncbi:hypothetical protein [Aeromonas phage Akh-2]|nr:hypothetical protein [Aeromonas phage Akh-2]